MDKLEKMARDICAKGGTSFCTKIGGDRMCCMAGRGKSETWDNCKANTVQLQLSGAFRIAEAQLYIAESE